MILTVQIAANWSAPYRIEYDGKYIYLIGGDKNFPEQNMGGEPSGLFFETYLLGVAEIRNALPEIIEVTETEIKIETHYY